MKHSEAAAKFSSTATLSKNELLVSKRQRGGKLAPVFGPPSREKEEAFIRKMIAKDRNAGRL